MSYLTYYQENAAEEKALCEAFQAAHTATEEAFERGEFTEGTATYEDYYYERLLAEVKKRMPLAVAQRVAAKAWALGPLSE